MALVTRRKQIHFKAETTPGTAETTGFTAINAYDFEAPAPDVGYTDIEGQAGFGARAGISTQRKATVSFKFDVTYKSGADPAWLALLGGCGFKLTTGVWAPTSLPPGASGGSSCMTIRYQQDGRQQVLHGACGSISFSATAGGKIVATATFTGILASPTDASLGTLTLPSGETVARFASVGTLTIGGTSPTVAQLDLDLGVEVAPIESCATASGILHFVPVNVRPTGSLVMLSELNSGFRPLSRAIAGTSGALAWTIGGSGNGVAVAAPALLFTGETATDRNGVAYDQGAFVLARSADTGDDMITFDGTAS